MPEKLALNDFPKHSPWPARLLGLTPWMSKPRGHADIEREFGTDKWGSLLKKLRADERMGLQEADLDRFPQASLPVLNGGHLELMSAIDAHKLQVNLTKDALLPYIRHASALIEFGAGCGSVILNLTADEAFRGMRFGAAEFTATGQQAISVLAERAKVDVAVGYCDLKEGVVSGVRVPPGSVIFTSLALMYLDSVPERTFEWLGALEPKAVVFIEPIYDHYPVDDMWGLMCRRYVEINAYNRDLLRALSAAFASGRARLLRESRNVFGFNPLLPVSVLAWAPE